MHGPSVKTIECGGTAGHALKRDGTTYTKGTEPGQVCRKDRRGQGGVETGIDHPFKMGSRRPRTRDIGESAAPAPHQIPAPEGCTSHSALDKPGGIGAKCEIRISGTELIIWGYETYVPILSHHPIMSEALGDITVARMVIGLRKDEHIDTYIQLSNAKHSCPALVSKQVYIMMTTIYYFASMMTPLKSAGRKYQMGEYLDATKNIMNTSACDISEFI